MYKPTEEPSYKQDNACDPANDPQATIGGNGYNRDGESESAATASAQPDKLLNIPQEMRERPQWCLAATDKRPLQLNKANADPTNPATWSTFDAVYAKAKEYGLGVGYVLTKDDPYTCIDLDIKDTTPAEHIKLIHKIRIR